MSATPTVFKPDFSDVLVQLMGETQDEYAALKALHGNFGKWEPLRASLVRAIALELRAKSPPAGIDKWTDKLLDAAAHADRRYVDFLAEGAKQATRYHELAEARGEQAQEWNRQNYNPTR